MILASTVLVVGAGAAAPYEIPTGRRLLEDVINRSREVVRDVPGLLEVDPACVASFVELLHEADCDSIDGVLERRRNDSAAQTAGRGVIAYCLAPYLRRTTLTAPDADWLKFVWNKMNEGATTLPELRRNRVHFVTFNFDQVIELKLERAIAALYPTASPADIREYVETVVIHVHGAMTHPTAAKVTPEWLQAAVRGMHLVHERGIDLTVNIVRNLVEEAEVLCCLGFGHHRDNVSKLGFPELRPETTRCKRIFATAYGLSASETAEAVKVYGPVWPFELGTPEEDCLAFLKNHHVLRG
jgi:hypothetical protein